MKKRVLAMAVALLLCAGMVPLPARAAVTDPAVAEVYRKAIADSPQTAAFLVDFDGDGREELLLLRAVDGMDGHIEVWRGTTRLFSDYIDGMYWSFYIVTRDAKTFLHINWNSPFAGYDVYYTVENGKWVKAHSAVVDDDFLAAEGRPEYCVDDVRTTQGAYEQLLNSFQTVRELDPTSVYNDPLLRGLKYTAAATPVTATDPVEALRQAKYLGDATACLMTRSMTQAYLDALKGFSGPRVWAILADYVGDGMPVLLVAVQGPRDGEEDTGNDNDWADTVYAVWWDGVRAHAIDLCKDLEDAGGKSSGIYSGYAARANGKTYLVAAQDQAISVTMCNHTNYYELSGGQLKKTGFWGSYNAESAYDGKEALSEAIAPIGPQPVEYDGNFYHYRPEDLLAAGWSRDPYGTYFYYDHVEGEPAGPEEGIEHIPGSDYVAWGPGDYEAEYTRVGVTQARMISALEVYLKDARDIVPLPTVSNLSIDFSKLSTIKTARDAQDYLRTLLRTGEAPNDIAKADLATFVEGAVSAVATQSVASGRKNRLDLTGKSVSALVDTALEARSGMEAVLAEAEVELNKTPMVTLRIQWQDMSMGQPCQIDIDPDLASALEGCALRLLLGSGQHYFQFSADDLRALSDALGPFSLQLSKVEEGVYTLNFLNSEGEVLESVGRPVTLALPADSPTATVMVSYVGGSDNWGGQYDPVAGVILFEARYSGQYEVLANDADISDIDQLDKESQDAIRFLVSKGYFDLTDGAFRPEDTLGRYEFTRALVGMFFALDKGRVCTFPDVPEDSPFYPYVASGQAANIVAGLGDGTFGGQQDIDLQQILTFCGRTLFEQKGYAAPDDPDDYLNAFVDGSQVADWARGNTALSIREQLIIRTGQLHPAKSVTRQEAAIILYRLFLKLYDVPPVALELPGESGGTNVVFIAAVAGAAAVVGGGTAAAVVLGRKRRLACGKK